MLDLEHDTSTLPPPWLVLIYQTADLATQDEVIRRLTALERADFTLQRTSSGPDLFVVAECPGLVEEGEIERVVLDVDPSARLVFASKPQGPLVTLVRGDDVL